MDWQKLIDHHREVKVIVVFHFKRLSRVACPGRSQFSGTIHTLKECVRHRQHKPKNKCTFLPAPSPLLYSGLMFLLLFSLVCFSLIHFVPVPLPTRTCFKKNIFYSLISFFCINEGAKSKPSVIQSAMLPSRAVTKKNFFRKHETISKQTTAFQMELLNLSHIYSVGWKPVCTDTLSGSVWFTDSHLDNSSHTQLVSTPKQRRDFPPV